MGNNTKSQLISVEVIMNRKSFVFSCLFFLTLAVALAVPPKNVIIMIGDGMGFQQVEAARYYASGNTVPLSFETLPYSGDMTTYSANSGIGYENYTDSAAAGTAIATGVKVNNDVVSVAIPGDGSDLLTLLEYFKAAGKSTGTVTTTYHEHTTPAAFTAHNPDRDNYSQIGVDIMTNSKPNVLLGGSATISTTTAQNAGYTTVTNRTQMLAVDTASVTHLFSQFGTGYMPYENDGTGMGTTYPHLSEMTQTALEILEKNENGFFLMVEGGRIDSAGHDNNLQRNIYETIEFANAAQVVMDWAAGRTDTLIIVTADHETGGLEVTETNPQQSVWPDVTWYWGNHTGQNVPIYARGVNAQYVYGTLDNTDIFDICIGATNGSGSSSEPSVDDFESYANGTTLQNASNWYSVDDGPFVQDGIGVDGSKGTAPQDQAAVMSGGEMRDKNRILWQELAIGDFVTMSMDFQASGAGTFDDDRLCLTAGHSSTSSTLHFGVQMEPSDNKSIQAYYRDAADGSVRTPIVTDIPITANAWYTLELVITKTGATQARFDTSLTRMSDSEVVASGSHTTGSVHARYFDDANGGLWPTFKNYDNITGAADNFYYMGVPPTPAAGLQPRQVTEDFNAYASGTSLQNAANWFSTTNAPVVGATNGVDGTPGVAAGSAVAVMSGGDMLETNRIRWQELAVGNYVTFSMDFQSSENGQFDDDRLFLNSHSASDNSQYNFGVQLKPDDNNRIESYYRSGSARVEEAIVTDIPVTASTWYTLHLTITKLGDTRARFDTSLTTLDGTVVAEGTWDTLTSDSRQPDTRYFNDENGGLWPGFKNHTTQPGPADNFYFAAGPVVTNPSVAPLDEEEGTVGHLALVGDDWEVQDVVLAFTAAGDPNGLVVPPYSIGRNIVKHNIYLSVGAPEDPALYLYASIPANNATGYEDPTVVFGPLPNTLLKPATTYRWQVEEVLDNGEGGYPDGDSNNIVSPIWSFNTVSGGPEIISISDHQLTDAGAAELTVEADESATHYRWFKVVGVQDIAGGESDDIPLTNGGLYSGTTTNTLTISGMSPNGSDDARYYAVAYRGDPEGSGLPSAPSEERWVWYPRLVSHYMFNSTDGGVIADTISGYDAQIMSGNGSVLPDLAVNAPAGLAGLGRITSLPFTAASQHYLQVDEQYAATFKDLTVSMWFKTTGTSSYQRIFDYGNGQGNSTFICPHYNGVGRAAFSVDVPDHGERRVESALDAVVNNVWTHITATLSGNTARLFINGEWVNMSAEFLYPPVDNGATIQNWIGRSQYGSDPYFSGNIADLKVWNYALTNEEVAVEYLNDTPSEDFICDREEFRHFQTMDSNDNCIIDLEDLAELAGMWMENRLLFAD